MVIRGHILTFKIFKTFIMKEYILLAVILLSIAVAIASGYQIIHLDYSLGWEHVARIQTCHMPLSIVALCVAVIAVVILIKDTLNS